MLALLFARGWPIDLKSVSSVFAIVVKIDNKVDYLVIVKARNCKGGSRGIGCSSTPEFFGQYYLHNVFCKKFSVGKAKL